MAMSLDVFSTRLEDLCKDHLEKAARVKEDFIRNIDQFLTGAKGDAPDLSNAHAVIFKDAMARLEKMAEEL